MTRNCIIEVPLEDFDGVEGVSNAPNQALQLVSQHVSSSREIVLHSSDPANAVGVSSIDGGLHSAGFVDVGILGIEGGRDGSASSSNPKPLKKRNCYSPCQSTRGTKKRLIWTQELHQHFLEIYNSSPNEKPVPKKILEKMREKFSYITRENVASHLQKHRLQEKKLKNKEFSSSTKPFSSKPLPLKVTKKPNFQSIHNSNISNSTSPNNPHQTLNPNNPHQTLNPNNPHQILQQTHSNSHQILQQTHSISTSSNSHQQIHLQNHNIIQHSTLQNDDHHQLMSSFHQIHLSDQNMMQQQPSFSNNNHNVHGGGGGGAITNIYSNSNLINVCEIQENPNFAPPRTRLGQSSNNNHAANHDDSSYIINPYYFPTSTNQISNVDAYGNGNNANNNNNNEFHHPMIMANSYDHQGFNHSNDYFFDAHQNFGFGDDCNVDLDRLCALETCSEALEFGYPLSFNYMNEYQSEFKEALQSIMCLPNSHLDDVSTLPQTLGNPHLHRQYFSPQLVNPANPCVEMEQRSNLTSNVNDPDHLRRDGNESNCTTMNESFSSKVNHDCLRMNGNGSNFTTMNESFRF